MKEMLDKAATLQMAVTPSERLGKDKREIHYGAGDGCVATALWSQGSAVATWDGGHHIDLKLLTFQENMQTRFANIQTKPSVLRISRQSQVLEIT